MKILKIVSVFILILTVLCGFAFSVRHVTLEESGFGPFTKPLIAFSSFPSTVKEVLTSKELAGVSYTHFQKDTSFGQVNNLEYDLYGLNSFYNDEKNRWDIKLFNFRDDSVLNTWSLYRKDFYKSGERQFKNSRPKNPLLLPDKSVAFHCAETTTRERAKSTAFSSRLPRP